MIDEESDIYRLIYLTNNTILLGKIVSMNHFGLLLKSPVTVHCNDNKVHFSLLFNSMTNDNALPINSTHMVSFANPSKVIIEHYNDFIDVVVPTIANRNQSLANNDMSITNYDTTTLH